MNPAKYTPINRAKHTLAVGLAAMLSVSTAIGQPADADTVRRLQEENAALRRQLAEIQASKPTPQTPAETATPAAQPASSSTAPASTSTSSTAVATTTPPADSNTVVLSPFVVSSEKDYGYLKTNSATATRIGAEIQKVPLAITVLSEDFVRDTGMRDIQDTLRYVASSSGDPRMGIRPPGNSATPSGNMKLRGFPISQRLRNGVNRYTDYSLDNIDRVEIIKGPAAIFYGLGYPGGVINFVTKKPQFTSTPSTFSYGYGGQGDNTGDQHASFDVNNVLNKQTAMRIVGAWDNLLGDKDWEFQKGYSITPSFTFKPFDSGKLVFNLEIEHSEMRRNQDDSSWIYNEQYFKDYKNPSNALLTAAGINPSDATALAQWQTKLAGNSYATWGNYKRIELNNPYWALYQTVSRGGKYTDLQGNRVQDDQFNFYGRGSYTQQKTDVLEFTADASPFPFLDARYVYTMENGSYEALTSVANPWGNGYEFNMAGLGKRGDFRKSNNHQLDLVLKKDFSAVKNKLLIGGLYNIADQHYTGYGNPYIYNNIPGAALYDPSLPANTTTNIPPNLNAYSWGLAFQTLKDRNGQPLNAYQVFQRYDPSVQVAPDISRVTATDRGIVDAGKPIRKEWYINYQADTLKDKLHVMGGYRWTYLDPNGGQRASSNPPWYVGGPDMGTNLDPSQYNAYGIGNGAADPTGTSTNNTLGSYYLSSFQKQKGTSWMAGLSYDITKDITVYVSQSHSFRPNSSTGALYTIGALVTHAADLGLDGNKELARIRAAGADEVLSNETGINSEAGVKVSLWDSKLVGTFSIFRLDREGEALEDVSRELAEPLNWSGPNLTGTFSTANATGGVRWYSNTSKRRVEGSEVEFVYTPMRNNQVVVSGSWLWTAKTLLDSSINPTATDAATVMKRYYTYDFRMPGTPEYRLNLFDTYTITDGPVRGLRLSLGARYSSAMNIQNSQLYDSKNGGLTAGHFWVFDTNIEYPWEFRGYRIKTGLNVTNLLDKDYSDGGGDLGTGGAYSLSPPRVWMLTNTLTF